MNTSFPTMSSLLYSFLQKQSLIVDLFAPMRQDPEEVVPLTPSHFFTGGALIAPPQQPDTASNISTLRRWNLVQHLNCILWKRWSKEYLNTLQKRTKWKVPNREWSVGDIVLLKDEAVYQRKWPLGRVEKIYPGADGKSRVVDVFVKGRTYRRP